MANYKDVAKLPRDNPNQWVQFEAGKGFGQTNVGKNLKKITDETMDENGELKQPYAILVDTLSVIRQARLLLTTAKTQSALYATLLEEAIKTVENLAIDFLNGLDLYMFTMYPSPLKVNAKLYEQLALAEALADLHTSDLAPAGRDPGYRGRQTASGFKTAFGVEIGPAPDGQFVMESFGWGHALQQLEASMSDTTDPDRPLFSEGSNMCGIVLAFGVNVPNPSVLVAMKRWNELWSTAEQALSTGLGSISEKFAAFADYDGESESFNEFSVRMDRARAYQGVPPNWERLAPSGFRDAVEYLVGVIRNYALAGKFSKAMAEVQKVADEWLEVLLDALSLLSVIIELAIAVIQALAALRDVNFYVLFIDPEAPPETGLYGGMDRFLQRVGQASGAPEDNLIIGQVLLLREPVSSTLGSLQSKWKTLTEFGGWADVEKAYATLRDEAGNLLDEAGNLMPS